MRTLIVNQKYSEYENLLSKERTEVYLNICNNNKIDAYRKYKLNSEISSVLYEILAHLEVLLRNAIVQAWIEYFSQEALTRIITTTGQPPTIAPIIKWPLDTSEMITFSNKQNISLFYHDRDITTATLKFNNYKVKKRTPYRIMANGDLISQLNFGFWYDSLRNPFNTINLAKLYQIFPNAPTGQANLLTLKQIRQKVYNAYQLRNRIAHHEPVINTPTSLATDFHDSIELINYLSIDYKDMFLKKKISRFVVLHRKI